MLISSSSQFVPKLILFCTQIFEITYAYFGQQDTQNLSRQDLFLVLYSFCFSWKWPEIMFIEVGGNVWYLALSNSPAYGETGRLNTKSFRYKSFRYELKQWNCIKILITSS